MSVVQRALASMLFALLAVFSFHSMKAIAAPPASSPSDQVRLVAAADEDEDEKGDEEKGEEKDGEGDEEGEHEDK